MFGNRDCQRNKRKHRELHYSLITIAAVDVGKPLATTVILMGGRENVAERSSPGDHLFRGSRIYLR